MNKKPKTKSIKKQKVTKRKKRQVSTSNAAGGHNVKSCRKYDRGGRVEAYTFGETLGKKNWP